MKKNLYDIMNEAEAKELEPLLENLQSKIPEGISAENIAVSLKNKRKKASAKARANWIRFGAVAACLALIIAAVPTAQYFIGTTAETKSHNETAIKSELGVIVESSIAYADSISYTYYLPLEDGTCLAKEIIYKLDNGKLNKTWPELLAPFFEHCKLDVDVVKWETTTEGESTQLSPDGKVVTHIPGTKTLHLYLESDELLDDRTLECLVNTAGSITYAKYIKLYHNGEPVEINGECPEKGFTNIKYGTAK
jgi:hypothetical protein